MLNNIPSSMQKLLTLSDISTAGGAVKNEDYFQLKRDHQNLVSALTAILTAVNSGEFSPIVDTGSPEGVASANYSLLYIDSAVPQLYYNPNYGEDTGWIAL